MVPKSNARPCGVARRLGCMVYDGLVILALWMLATLPLVIVLEHEIRAGAAWFQAWLLLIAFVYLHLSWRLAGQTLGMRAWCVWLTRSDGQTTGIRQHAARFAGALASIATLGLGYAWALTRRDRKGWPELFSNTRLVHRPRR